jgi:ABC-type lipoprotein export system ATPase subunit
LIKVEKITKSFGKLQVLKGIDLNVPAGKLYSIVGPSGAGKTTLLQIIGSLSSPDAGKVTINNQNISVMNERQLADFRNRQIGFVFQFHYLLPEFSALENVCIPAFIAKFSRKEAEEKAREYPYRRSENSCAARGSMNSLNFTISSSATWPSSARALWSPRSSRLTSQTRDRQ